MSDAAVVTMVVAMVLIWGSLGLSVGHAVRTHRRKRKG